MSRILAISGKRGAGKDTLADFLVRNGQELFGCPAVKCGLADPIKEIIRDLMRGDPAILWGLNAQKEQLIPGSRVTYREAMKIIGGQLSYVKPLAFVDTLIRRSNPLAITIISDLRIPCEAEYFRQQGAKLIRLTRAENPDDTHPTETGLDGWNEFDAVVDNRNIGKEFTQQLVVKLLHQWSWLREGFQW